MPKALLTTEAILHQPGRHTEILESAGFEVTYPQNSEFGRGLCGLEESVKELTDVDALLAGSEFVTSEMLSRLPQLRQA